MTNLKPSATEIKALAKALDENQYASAQDMAKAALEMAYEAYERRANFVVVGQLYYSDREGFVRDNGERVAFGPFENLTPAREAGEQLSYSLATHEEFRWWLLPYHQGKPAAWFRHRKAIRDQHEVPLTNAERLIIRRNPDKCHLWGLSPDGKRLKPGNDGTKPAEAA